MRETKIFYAEDIAMMEHNFIQGQDILEWKAENLQWYLSGVHDFAEQIISKICEKGKEGG